FASLSACQTPLKFGLPSMRADAAGSPLVRVAKVVIATAAATMAIAASSERDRLAFIASVPQAQQELAPRRRRVLPDAAARTPDCRCRTAGNTSSPDPGRAFQRTPCRPC